MYTFGRIEEELTVTIDQAREIAGRFAEAMAAGLAGRPSPLKMLPSYLGTPRGDERGRYLALDFGGSNVRAQEIELTGAGGWLVRRHVAAPLRDRAAGYDYTAASATGEELFAFIADLIAGVAEADRDYLLGHTFSFPCRQQDVNHAELIAWTKEIKTAGVEGREVNSLLAAALARRSLGCVRPVAVLNDTVGTLLAASYADPDASIAAICGTGHNACYYDADRAMIINMESGNFDALPVTRWDAGLDAASERPGTQRMEKMVAGRYLGELVRLAAADLGNPVGEPYSLSTRAVASWLEGAAGVASLRPLAELVVARSARLVAAALTGMLAHIDPAMTRRHTIAVDGSLYEKMPGYPGIMAADLAAILGEAAGRVSIRMTKDGSGVGAAIAAAVAR